MSWTTCSVRHPGPGTPHAGGRLTRQKLAGQFRDCAADRAYEPHQLRARPVDGHAQTRGGRARGRLDAGGAARRESCSPACSTRGMRRIRRTRKDLGWGGDRPSPTAHRPRSAAGRRQLVERDVVHRPGAARGRRASADGKKTPEVAAGIDADGHEAGDPVRGLKWTAASDRQGRRRTVQARHRHLLAHRRPASKMGSRCASPQEASGASQSNTLDVALQVIVRAGQVADRTRRFENR